MGKSHKLQENEAILKESFLSYKTKYICSVSKHGLHKPCICPNCYTCVERIYIHLHHFHQINKGSTEIQKKKKKKKKIKNTKKLNRHFEANFSNIYEDLDNDTSQGEESEENEHEEETSTIKPTQTPKPVKKDKTPS